MNIYSHKDCQLIENFTCEKQDINHNVLIQRAGNAFTDTFLTVCYRKPLPVIIFAGNGNNGADAIVIANQLASKIEHVELYICRIANQSSAGFEFCEKRLSRAVHVKNLNLQDLHSLTIPDNVYILDGILGAGINREPSSELGFLIDKLNNSNAYKIAIDIPTGMNADGRLFHPVVKCDATIGLGCLKLGYFLYHSEDFIGSFHFAQIGLENSIQSNGSYIEINAIKNILRSIKKQTHKYLQGSVLMIGGQYGMVGCMRLAGEAALRCGCGLITLHVPKCAVEFLQGSLPEALIEPDENFYSVGLTQAYEKFNTIGIGPGMGLHVKQHDLIRRLLFQQPACQIVWDADALKILGSNPDLLEKVPRGSIFTPHRGEFVQLFEQKLTGLAFHEFAIEKAVQYQIILVVKGPDTIIYLPDGTYYVNSTGNSGMATAGSGDVLTGMICGILAQGYSPEEAAIVGVFLHGLAGDIAVKKLGHHALIASDIIHHIGHAFIKVHES